MGRRLPLTGYVLVQLKVGGKELVYALQCSYAPGQVGKQRGSGAGRYRWVVV